jgi:dihydrofolate reductase
MRKLIASSWITADGLIADPSGSIDWVMGDDELAAYESALIEAADTVMLGRVTYQQLASYWPQVPSSPNAAPWEKAYAEKINARSKVVVSRSLENASWSDSRILRDVTAESVTAVKEGSDRSIVTFGSATLVQELSRLGLVDEYHLLVHPVLLGSGKSLFGPLEGRLRLERVRTEPFKSGVTLLVYKAAVPAAG